MSANPARLAGNEQTPLALLLTERRSSVSLPDARTRDPRVAPVSIHRNVSIAETCTFYGVQDAISHCRVPRSCRDCLAKPGCVLSGDGVCRDATSYEASRDYRNATFSNNSALVSTTANFDFVSGSASYCEANDAVCIECRENFKLLGRSNESAKSLQTQFCVGDGGCVCIGLCEVPEAWAARVYDLNCSQPSPVMRNQEPRRLEAFTTKARDPRAPLVNVYDRHAAEESCALTTEQDLRGCHRPRTCRDCLAKPNCAIVDAQCVGMDNYNASKDFRITILNSTNNTNVFHMGSAQFASANASYCSQNDPVCATCGDAFRRSIVARYTWDRLVVDSDFCVGTNGCVCIEACDSILWTPGVIDTSCSKITRNTVNTETIFTQVALAVGVWFVCLLLYGQLGQEAEPEPEDYEPPEIRRNMLDAAPAAGRLDLFGWRAFYDRLLEKEQELLLGEGNGELMSPVAHPMDFLDMATAPDFDEDDSSAPTANDPRALASAPVFRVLREDENEEDQAYNTLTPEPSAPDFDMDDAAWLNESRSSNERGPFMRRSRRVD